MKAIIDYTIDVSSEYEGVDCVVPHENYIHIQGFAYGRVYSLDIQKRDILGVCFIMTGCGILSRGVRMNDFIWDLLFDFLVVGIGIFGTLIWLAISEMF